MVPKLILGWFRPLLTSNLVLSKPARNCSLWTSLIPVRVGHNTPWHPGAENKYVSGWRKLCRGPRIPMASLECKMILSAQWGHEKNGER